MEADGRARDPCGAVRSGRGRHRRDRRGGAGAADAAARGGASGFVAALVEIAGELVAVLDPERLCAR